MKLDDRFRTAVTLAAFIDTAQANRDLWRSIYARAKTPEWALKSPQTLPTKVRMVVLLEDWCTDAVSTVPHLAALADQVPERLEVRVLRRDENLDIMDTHLSPTGGRAIPVVILLDEAGREFAWWGSRPAALQAFFDAEGKNLSKEERVRRARAWYARDRGESMLREILAIAGAELPPGGILNVA